MSTRVEGFIVAQRRPHTGDPDFIFGGDWSEWHATRDEADAAAAAWRNSQQSDDPSNVAVFALVRVDEPHIPLIEMQAMAFQDHELVTIDEAHHEARYHGWVADLPETAGA